MLKCLLCILSLWFLCQSSYSSGESPCFTGATTYSQACNVTAKHFRLGPILLLHLCFPTNMKTPGWSSGKVSAMRAADLSSIPPLSVDLFLRSSGTSDFFFFFCIPGHARFSVQWVRRSPQSATVSQPVPKASCGPPPDWAMSGSQVIEGGAGLQDVVGGLRTRATWTFVWVGNFQCVEVGEELTVSSSKSKDCDLSCSVQLVDTVLLCPSV